MRSIHSIQKSVKIDVGPLEVAQPLPSYELSDLDPFLLLHHAGPQKFDPDGPAERLAPHPHRGFEPVTFVFRGEVLHKDTMGNEGFIGAGEVQWITSGRGILHSEGPTARLQNEGGELELIQLWVNLPASKKMMDPTYQELRKNDIPKVALCDGLLELSIVAGEWSGVTGPARTQSSIVAASGRFENGLKHELELPKMESIAIYALSAGLEVNGRSVSAQELVVFNGRNEQDGDKITLGASGNGHFLLIAGEPLNEPIASRGPFVMNTMDEIREAFKDFAGGKFGELKY